MPGQKPLKDGDDPVYDRAQVVSIINSVLSKVETPQSDWERRIYQEMQDLKAVIESLRQELRSVSPGDISRDHIPGATDELDAVVSLTEEATNKIMNACDQVQDDISGLPEDMQTRLQEQLTNIFEACTFQDITGQRISKVIAALKKIDIKTQDMMAVLHTHFPETGQSKAARSTPPVALTDSDSLMNGPQLPGQGVSQDDIDRILQEFGQI